MVALFQQLGAGEILLLIVIGLAVTLMVLRSRDTSPRAGGRPEDRLRELDRLRRENLITEGEYQDRRRAIVNEL